MMLPMLSRAADGVFLRIKLVEPADEPWFVRLGGYIHNDPWVLPSAVWPAEADKEWHDSGMEGIARLLDRLWRLGLEVAEAGS